MAAHCSEKTIALPRGEDQARQVRPDPVRIARRERVDTRVRSGFNKPEHQQAADR